MVECIGLGHRSGRYSLVTFTNMPLRIYSAHADNGLLPKCETCADPAYSTENWRIFRASCGRPRELLWARVAWIEYHGPSAWLKSRNQCTLRIIYFSLLFLCLMFMQFIMFEMHVWQNSMRFNASLSRSFHTQFVHSIEAAFTCFVQHPPKSEERKKKKTKFNSFWVAKLGGIWPTGRMGSDCFVCTILCEINTEPFSPNAFSHSRSSRFEEQRKDFNVSNMNA